MRKIFLLTILIIFVCNVSAQIVFMPQWTPQAQFAGYYVALEKGFYKELDLEVEITHPPHSQNAIEFLKNGEVDIVTQFLVSGLTAYSNGVDLINIGQLSQNSSLLFVAKKSKNILTINDFNNKKIGVWKSGFDELPRILVDNYKLDVSWTLLTSSVNLFLMDGIDILTVTYFNEYDMLINSGIDEDELTRFFLKDYGMNIPEDGLYCTTETYKTKHEELRKFYEASFKGWLYAKYNTDEALDIVLKVMKDEHIPGNYAHQKWMLNKMIDLIVPQNENTDYGELSLQGFQLTYEILKDANYLKTDIKYKDFYKPLRKKTNDFEY